MSGFTDSNRSYICYSEENTRIMNTIDERFRNEALALNALEYHIPAMIDADILEKCGYFSSFPQHLTMASHIHPNCYKNIKRCEDVSSENLKTSNIYFTPAACLHIYPMLENEEVTQKVVTTKARVYRYEGGNYDGKIRFWDFTVREIVFVGDSSFVKEGLEKMKQAATFYSAKIGLPTRIISATDSFYPTRKNMIKAGMQESNLLKYELITQLEDKEVALASFNYHDTHFSKPFSFDNKSKIVTGCVGFGLERWVEAINEYKIKL